MVSSTRQAIACVLLILCAAGYAHSQSVTEKSATASISGKVTIKGKGVPGILVVANERNAIGPNRPRYRATTDQTGNYRISLPAGTYQVTPVSPSLVPENQLADKFVIIGEGETLELFGVPGYVAKRRDRKR
ncbi:MAG TPA: carboxypeptidase-like regulatory domain-containing protein [Pyrinomonadaceae bacterium]